MKANRKSLARDETALSVVIGALLVAGLLFATFVTIRVRHVPIWTEDAESTHMRLVEEQMSTLKADIDRQSHNITQQAITNPLSLGSGRNGFLDVEMAPHGLTFVQGGSPVTLSSNRIRVQEENGNSFLGVDETWTALSATTDTLVEDVDRVLSLRLRWDGVSDDNAGDEVEVTITDADGAAAGEITASVATHTGGFDVTYRTLSPSGAELLDQGDSFADQAISPYWIDLLRPELRFSHLLSAAKAPYSITLDLSNVNAGGTNDDLAAEYSMTYSQTNGGSSVVVGSGGQVRNAWSVTHLGGTMTYDGDNQRHPPQTYVLESGALVLDQSDGDVFAVEPAFDAALVGNVTRIELTLPTLSGRGVGLRGEGTVAVTTRPTTFTSLLAEAPRLNVTVTTAYPALWTSLWNTELDALADFDSGEEFTVSSTATTATLNVYGASVSPSSLYYDLSVLIRQADIDVEV